MNKLISSCIIVLMTLLVIHSCTSGEEERMQQETAEQARQDSLEMVSQAELEAVRRDSLEAAAMAAADAEEARQEPDPLPLEFDPDGRFTVQVQSWRSREKAMNRAELLRSVGFESAYVMEHGDSSTGDTWYRVRAGDIATLEMARLVQERLSSEFGMESWIDMADE